MVILFSYIIGPTLLLIIFVINYCQSQLVDVANYYKKIVTHQTKKNIQNFTVGEIIGVR
jgi:hypothetical protein